MIKIYGSSQCPDCRNCKENFDKAGIEYEFIDILLSLSDLKKFLVMRDNNIEFDRFKKSGKIGIPCFIDTDKNNKIFFDWENFLKNKNKDLKINNNIKNSCSIDGKGC